MLNRYVPVTGAVNIPLDAKFAPISYCSVIAPVPSNAVALFAKSPAVDCTTLKRGFKGVVT